MECIITLKGEADEIATVAAAAQEAALATKVTEWTPQDFARLFDAQQRKKIRDTIGLADVPLY